MLPTDTIGVLNVAYEIDTSGEHARRVTSKLSTLNATTGPVLKFVSSTVELQNRAVCEAEPYQVIGLPVDWYTKDIPE
jgi:hypothetical protein